MTSIISTHTGTLVTHKPCPLVSPEDIIVIVGQDGLVAKVAKYLSGQPVIGIDPEPGRNSSAIVRFAPSDADALVELTIHHQLPFSQRTMVEGVLDDGQRRRPTSSKMKSFRLALEARRK